VPVREPEVDFGDAAVGSEERGEGTGTSAGAMPERRRPFGMTLTANRLRTADICMG